MSDTTHRILTYAQYATTPVGFSFASCIQISRFCGRAVRKSKVQTYAKHIALFVKCNIPRENMSPFLTCFPLLPYGRALRAGQHSALAHQAASPHYATRCVGAKKKQSAPATSYSRLVLGAPFLVAAAPRVSSSLIVSASIRALQMSKVRTACHHNCEQREQYHLPLGKYNFAKQNITAKQYN